MAKEKLAIIIPTKNRPGELKRLLAGISEQSVKPVQVIIADGGDAPLEGLFEEFPGLKISYVRVLPASLTVQRNAGIRKLTGEATLAAFFDDDIMLEKNAIENMMDFWGSAPDNTAGAAFNITGVMCRKPAFVEKIFLTNAEKPSSILLSGFQSRVCSQIRTLPVEWLAGCGMVWRKNIFKEFMFDEWFTGYARYEEIDFSYRVGRKYKMFIVADAKIRHLNGPENIGFSFSLGEMQIVNRVYFVRKNPGLIAPLCYWACFGLFLNNILKGLFYMDRRYLLRAKGNMAGFIKLFRGNFSVSC